MMKDPYPIHGRCWRWRTPWRWSCRCGMAAYPCIAEHLPDLSASSEAIYAAGLRYVQDWRDVERRRWSGRAW